MTDTKKPVILIDGSSYLYRAFHALPPLANSRGEPTGAVYGVIGMIKKLLSDYDPQYIAVVFDPRGKTHRNEWYEDYKAHRPSMPDDLSLQIPPIFEIITALGLKIIIEEGIEADDVIGTLALQATQEGMTTLISTGDKDMAQLVNPHVTLINTMTNSIYDREAVIKKFGVPPEKVIDYLALVGDKVDNIPGVPNVGPKTAAKWLMTYENLEGVIARADEVKGKVGENLKQALPILPLSKKLVTIMTDLRLPYKIEQLARQSAQSENLIDLYRKLEFKGWLSELLSSSISDAHSHYEMVTTQERLDYWLNELNQCKVYAFDIQVTASDAMSTQLVGIAFATAPAKSVYFPLLHDYENAPKQLNATDVLQAFNFLFNDSSKVLIGENLKFVVMVLRRYGIEIKNVCYDTMLESYIQNSAAARHDKNILALKYLGRRALSYEDIGGKGAKQIACNKIDVTKVTQYAAESADIIFQVHEAMSKKMAHDKPLTTLLENIEMPLSHVLARMEFQGVLIDTKMLQTHSHELQQRLQSLEQAACELSGCEFNLNSPKQLQAILYEKLQLPIFNKTPTGQPSTSEETLQELAHDYELPRIILEHRSLNKIKNTYTDRLPHQVNPKTGRVHTCYNQAITATGRLSSTDPNLQNIPIRHEEGRRIRQAFIAPKGYKIVSADYSQIELRIMAHLSKDPKLLLAFENNEDIHVATAAEVFNIPLEAVTTLQRRSAKAINFGLIYGMSSFGLARQLGIEKQIAQNYIDRYFDRYVNIKAYMDQTRQLAHQLGYVETLNKRKLYLPEINATNLQRQRAAERAAINAPLQGTAAEIIKIAMINIDRWLRESNSQAHMIMQVHDELVFEVPEDRLAETLPHIKEHMTKAIELEVPLVVDIGVGYNWDEAH